MNHRYIPELDGLRALAVSGVVLYHLGFRHFPGGFLGVDVFFVISGFLISRLIAAELQAGNFSLTAFYERRVRRIIPALFFVLAGSSLVFALLSSPAEFQAQRAPLFAALLSVGNFYFHGTLDYFARNAANPLLHTWSLSVEEQFYALYPLLLVGLAGWTATRRQFALGLIFALSFLAWWVYRTHDASAAFYLPWLRAWELLAGAGLALGTRTHVPAELARAASYAGPVLIAASFSRFGQQALPPGLPQILAVAGAALSIAGTGVPTFANRALAAAAPRFLGRISYSLYLVHWPLVCTIGFVGFQLAGPYRLATLAACVALAYATYELVEQPFRRSRAPARRTFALAAGGLLAVALLALSWGALTQAWWARNPAAMRLSQAQRDPLRHFGPGNCFLTTNDSVFDEAGCLRLNPRQQNILLMGDSHSAHFAAALAKQFPASNILQASASGCIPLLAPEGEKRCTALVNRMYYDWLPRHGRDIAAIVLSAKWQPENERGLVALNERVKAAGTRLVVLGPSPSYQIPLPRILAYQELYGIDLSQQLLLRSSGTTDAAFRANLAGEVPYFSVFRNLCAPGACTTTLPGAPLLFDSDHFTREGADLALAGLANCLLPDRPSCPPR